ncbi:MAG: pseudouridine synthase [Bacteroidetes bacterium]|nr:pseudouridine synthase [Bacteroidota bacterium]
MDKIRINKYLADKGFTTRRGADILITEKKVLINGKIAKLGDKVGADDKVTLKDFENKKYVYYAYYKPKGIATLASGQEKSIKDSIEFPEKVFPLGRLDKDSEGLIIMTNDGRLTDKLLNPKFEHQKEYYVEIDRPITHEFLVKISNRVDIGIHKTKKSLVRKVDLKAFEIILLEGKNRQIRRMCGVLGAGVKKLKRFRIMNIMIGKLKPNHYRNISGKELQNFLADLGIS